MMSSGEVGRGEQRHWCHQCATLITPIGEEGELICPRCHGGFVEEIEGQDNPVHTNLAGQGGGGGFEVWHAGGGGGGGGHPFILGGGGGHPYMLGGGGDGGEELMNHLMESLTTLFNPGAGAGVGAGAGPGGSVGAAAGAGAGAGAAGSGRGPLGPMMMMQGRLQNLLGGGGGGGGGNIQIIFEGGGGGGGGERLAGNIGDYFWGQGGLEQLIQQLAENDPNRYGTPPASKAAVEAMPTIKITQDHLNSDASQCAVCKETFEEGANARQMPCKHMYHEDCILPWLEQHSTCPVCRFAMPTDEPQQERPAAAQAAQDPSVNSSVNPRGNTNSEGAGVGAAQLPNIVNAAVGGGRRIRIQLPWFRFNPQATQQSQAGSSSGQGNSEESPNSQGDNNDGHDHPMPDARHEDLD